MRHNRGRERHDSGVERFDQDVRRGDKVQQSFTLPGRLNVEHNALLAERHRGPVERRVGVAAVRFERRHPARFGAARRFDLDHFGAEVGEHASGQLGTRRGEVDDADPEQRRVCHVGGKDGRWGIRAQPDAIAQ